MKKLLIAIVWIGCGVFNYGFLLGGFTNKFPQFGNLSPAICGFIVGPFGIPATLLVPGPPYHFMWKPYTKEQRWEAYHKKYGALSREDFESQD